MNTISTNPSDLIRIASDDAYFVKLNDINGIKKVYAHPNDANVKKGFPKYQIFLNCSTWSWVLISVEDFEKYLAPFILNYDE